MWDHLGIGLNQIFGKKSPFYKNPELIFAVSFVNTVLMLVSLILFIPYFRLKTPRKDMKKRKYVVYAMVIYIVLNVCNAMVFIIWDVNVDSYKSYLNTE